MDLGDDASIDVETSETGFEEMESVDTSSLDVGTELMEAMPHSVRAVLVTDGLEAIEDIGARGQADSTAQVREVLANAAAFRSHHLLHKAIETLQSGLDVNPNAFDLRLVLKDVLLDAGDHTAACDQMITIASIYVELQDIEAAAQTLTELLSYEPTHAGARRMLGDLGYQVPNQLQDTMEVAARGVTREPMATVEAFPGYENNYAPTSARYDSSEPLPSYDLEEINPSYAMSSVPPAEDQVDYAALLTTDDPFSTLEPRAASSPAVIDDPFADVGGRDAPLPSFPLSEEERVPSELMELDAGYDQLMGDGPRGSSASYPDYGRRAGSQPYDTGGYPRAARSSQAEIEQPLPHLEVVEETHELAYDQTETYNEERPDAPAPLAGTTRAFMGGDSLEDALEEAEFFESRGLFDDALAILEEQSQRFPNHPLLLERMREVREAVAGASGSGELVVPHSDVMQAEPIEDHAFDIAASLDVFDGGMLGEPEAGPDGFGRAVDVEEVFAKFKEGVKQQVSESDSQTHYDLGVAYKEMGLLSDAINEFTMAARDPTRECVCWSMIGIVRLDIGSADGAIEAFIRGLHSEHKTPDQELALYYELGNIYEARGNPQEALYYFEKVRRRDPSYRDVAQRVQNLQSSARRPALRTAVGEDDFDRAFDDLFGEGK
jgi:tetratricopeptide (TPR) repeat protein